MTLLEIARSGDRLRLIEVLAPVVNSFDENGGGRLLTVDEQLLCEALTYARLGDLAEATHRLRLRAEPKFPSIQDCQSAYRAAMAEKRGVRA